MTEQEELKQFADECFSETKRLVHESKYKPALDTALRAIEIYNQIHDTRGEASVANFLSFIYEALGNNSLELQFALNALEIALDNNAYDLSATFLNNLGSKLLTCKNYDRALFYFEHAIEMYNKAVENNMFEGIRRASFNSVLNMNISNVCLNKGDIVKAKEYYEIVESESKNEIMEDIKFPLLAFKGLYFWKNGDYKQADLLIDEIMTAVENNAYTADYLEVFLEVIELLQLKKDYERWEKVLKIMENHLNEDSSIYFRVEVQNQWLIFFRETGRTDEFKEACVKYYELSSKKAIQDTEKSAVSIELNAEMRKTIRKQRASEEKINVDSLTGIGNRNKMLADSIEMINESVANHSPIAIGLLDIDFFKECNDTYGHIAGDKCIKTVAKIISDVIGENGNVYRYGGDEFLILMKTGNVEFLNSIGQKIQDNLATAKIPNEKSPLSPYVTISQGYTSANAEAGDNIDSLVTLADRVLYAVKRSGRNNYKYLPLDVIMADT